MTKCTHYKALCKCPVYLNLFVNVRTAEDMDRLDEALRCTIKKLWPIDGKKMHAMLIPPHDGTSTCFLPRDASWRRSVVVSGVRRMNEVNPRRARLVLGWVTAFGRVYHLGM